MAIKKAEKGSPAEEVDNQTENGTPAGEESREEEMPAWAKQILTAIQSLNEKESEENAVEIPIPPAPVPEALEAPELLEENPQPPEAKKSLWKWLF